jgi:hypothetical protein
MRSYSNSLKPMILVDESKNIWYEAYYDEEDKDFGFIFIKDKYVD